MNQSIRISFLTCQTPYPPIGGAALRNWQNINILKSFGPISIFSIPLPFNQVAQDSVKSIPGVEDWEEHPVREERVGGWRKFWKRFNVNERCQINPFYQDDIAEKLDHALLRFKPDLVIVSEIGLIPYLKVIQRHPCKVIFDDHNVEAPLFKEKCHQRRGIKKKIKDKLKYLNLRSLEKASIKQADQVWLCSKADCHLVAKTYGKSPNLRLVPNGVNIPYYQKVMSKQVSPSVDLNFGQKTIIFVGTFGYLPNSVAAQWLISEIFPKLQDLHQDSQLILAGSNPTPWMLDAAAQNPNILVTGRVEDLRSYIASASVVVIPLRQGGGTRLKILEAFASGRAVISTTKGAEGLDTINGKHLLIRDSTSTIVNGICELWDNPSLEASLVQNAFEFVQARYSWKAVNSYVRANIQDLYC